jgi:5'(3')-deoxyribonucleotidase
MTKKQIIAVDVDDVLADTTEFWRLEVNRRAGISLEPEHWRVPGEYSGYYERLWQSHGVAELISIEDIDAIMKADQSKVPVMAEAKRILHKLAKSYNLVVVTARNTDQKESTWKWLDAVFPGIFSEIYFNYDEKTEVKRTKGEVCADIGASWLIDDHPGHCRDAMDKGVGAILYGTYGWHVEVPERVVRCKTWKDVEKYFDAKRG